MKKKQAKAALKSAKREASHVVDVRAEGLVRPSNLDGLQLIAVDADPDEALCGVVMGASRAKHDVVGIIPFLFYGLRRGYLVITYDRKKRTHGTS